MFEDCYRQLCAKEDGASGGGLAAGPGAAASTHPGDPDRLARIESLLEQVVERLPAPAAPGTGGKRRSK